MTYGIVIGLIYAHVRKQSIAAVYLSLITAMAAGRIVWGVVRTLLSGAAGTAFTWELFIAGALLNAIPGIILHLILIPAVMAALDRSGVYKMRRAEA